jgi:general secretion pathway protein J
MTTPHALSLPRRRRGHAGVTLLEVLVASAILSLVGVMIFAAFEHTGRVRARLGSRQEHDHVARIALQKISRDLRGAFLSAHVNPNQQLVAVVTAFVGRDSTPGDQVDMTTFTHRRLMRGVHEGDAAEVGYRVEARRGGEATVYDLLRRESARIDNDPLRGGTLDVLVPDVASFSLRYYDQATDQWVDTWDTTQATGQAGRLPPRVRVALTIREGEARGGSTGERRYLTETPIMIQEVLRFGLPIDFR